MTVLRLKFIHRFKDRHGTIRHYFRRPGSPRAALPGLPGSAEFMAAYQAALGSGEAQRIGADRLPQGSMSALIIAYYTSAEWKQLARVTQATYRNVLERLRSAHGDKMVANLQREHVRHLIAAKAATPSAANSLLKLLRILMRFALDEGWRKDDPTHGVRRLRVSTDGFHTWSEAEIAAFEAHWPIGSRARLAMALLLYTGQRRSDMIRMGRQHLKDGCLQVRQQKTGTKLSIPVHPRLAEILSASAGEQMTFLLTQPGAPFTSAGFGNWFADRVREAGLPRGCAAHGLRKAAARRLAEAGCSAHEIMAITGHQSLKEVSVYTQAADQARLAVRAVKAMGSSDRER
jgi:integrase